MMATMLTLVLYWGERGAVSWSPALILGVALLLRVMFLFAAPQLSDDIHRYLWDGSTLLRGVNPYAVAPAAVKPPSELASVHALINHPEYVTIYPPAAQMVFAGGAALGGSIVGLKAFLLLLDLGLCALLMELLRRLGLPVWRAVLYAWNPLPVLEIAGSGHVDGAGLTMLLGACCLLLSESAETPSEPLNKWPFLLSGVLLACAGLVKLFPLALVPLLFLLVPPQRRLHFAAGFIGAMAALLLPFLSHLANLAATLNAYARNWEFSGFAFNTLRSVTGSGAIARALLSGCFLLVVISITLRLARRLDGEGNPAARGRLALESCYGLALALLLLTPTLQPWYALFLAALLPFSAGPAGLVLCWVVFLTYRVQIQFAILGQWIENPYVTAAVFLAPLLAFGLSRLFGRVRMTPA